MKPCFIVIILLFCFCQRYAERCRGSGRYYSECVYENLDTPVRRWTKQCQSKTIFMYSPNVKSLIIFGPNTIHHVVLTEDMMTLERPSSMDEPTTDYRELREAVQSVINTMPPKRRSVFCLSRFKSLTNQEIADKLGISIRTVEKHIELALRTFKEQLGSFFALFVGWFL